MFYDVDGKYKNSILLWKSIMYFQAEYVNSYGKNNGIRSAGKFFFQFKR